MEPPPAVVQFALQAPAVGIRSGSGRAASVVSRGAQIGACLDTREDMSSRPSPSASPECSTPSACRPSTASHSSNRQSWTGLEWGYSVDIIIDIRVDMQYGLEVPMPDTALSQITAPHAAPDVELDAIRSVFGVSQAEIATILGTTPRTVSRWRSTSAAHVAPRPAAARSLRELARLRWLLETEVGQDASARWLRTPNAALRGQAPLDVLLAGDQDRVLGLVVSLGEGGLF